MLNVTYGSCAECHWAECRYAECRCAFYSLSLSLSLSLSFSIFCLAHFLNFFYFLKFNAFFLLHSLSLSLKSSKYFIYSVQSASLTLSLSFSLSFSPFFLLYLCSCVPLLSLSLQFSICISHFLRFPISD